MSLYDPERRCPKCGHDDVFTSYEANSHGYACMGHSKGFASTRDDCEVCADEHFHRGCRRCQHKWREELNPAHNGAAIKDRSVVTQPASDMDVSGSTLNETPASLQDDAAPASGLHGVEFGRQSDV